MYNCEVCKRTSQPGATKLKHTIYREKVAVKPVYERHIGTFTGKEHKILVDEKPMTCREIVKEIAVCQSCHDRLRDGVPINILHKHMKAQRLLKIDTAPEYKLGSKYRNLEVESKVPLTEKVKKQETPSPVKQELVVNRPLPIAFDVAGDVIVKETSRGKSKPTPPKKNKPRHLQDRSPIYDDIDESLVEIEAIARNKKK